MITCVNSYEFTLRMIFKFFNEKSRSQTGPFQENRGNHVLVEYVNIWLFTLVIIFVIVPQK